MKCTRWAVWGAALAACSFSGGPPGSDTPDAAGTPDGSTDGNVTDASVDAATDAGPQPIFTADFEQNLSAPWSGNDTDSGDSIGRSTLHAHGGNRSARFNTDGSDSQDRAMLYFDTSGESKVHIRYFALVAAAPNGFIMVSHARNGADPWLSSDIYGDLSADLFSFDSTGFQITAANTIAVDTWHQVDVSIDTRSGQEEARFWLDEVLVGSLDSNDLAGGVIGRLEFGIILVPNSGNVPREVFIDDVVVTRESPLDLP